jgi:hypothetical protein
MSTGSSAHVEGSPSTVQRVRLIVFRVLATLAGLFFLVAVVVMASAPWVLLQAGDDPHAEVNRWFRTVAGSVDAIAAGVWVALIHRPRRTLLVVEMSAAVVVAGAIILPFQPSFAATPRGRDRPAHRLPVLGRRSEISIVVGRGAPRSADPCSTRWSRASCDSSPCPSPPGGRDRPPQLRRVGGPTTQSTPRYSRWPECSRQPWTRLAHPEEPVQCGMALSGFRFGASSSSLQRVLGSHWRRNRIPGGRRVRRGRLARSRAPNAGLAGSCRIRTSRFPTPSRLPPA